MESYTTNMTVKFKQSFVIEINSKEVSEIVQKLAFKAGYEWCASGRSVIEEWTSYPVLFHFDNSLTFNNDVKSYQRDPKITLEQAIEYLLNNNVTWDVLKIKEMSVAGQKITIYSNGDVRFGCTLATKDDVEKIVAERNKLLKRE
jgi:hypothetical protein